MVCGSPPKTPPDTALTAYAAAVKRGWKCREHEVCPMLYPMYTLPLQILMDMTEVSPHEELLDAGMVLEFDHSMGRALFVSHQWLGLHHPDPKGQQIQVLKHACANILSGKSQISAHVGEEFELGRLKKDGAALFKKKRLFLWYDYFCCPQKPQAPDLQLAIDSIPAYIGRCELFVVLCPDMEHQDSHLGTDYNTWTSRGWCRLEWMARELSTGNTHMISLESASLQTYELSWQAAFFPPGEGTFSMKYDKEKVGAILARLFDHRLFSCLAEEDICAYRFWLNQQRMRFSGLEQPELEAARVPGFDEQTQPDDPEALLLARFMHDNGFVSVSERDEAGWSPMCYAVMNGDPQLVSALLSAKADVNDRILKAKPEWQIQKQMSVLQISAYCRNAEAVKLLLAARADVNDTDARGATALHWAMISNSAEGVRILCETGANAELMCQPGTSALTAGAVMGSASALRELLRQRPLLSLQDVLHFGLMLRAGVESVSILLEAGADVNQQLQPVRGSGWWKVFQALRLKHWFSSSRFSTLAYHHAGATPLMFSILTGNFEAAQCLVAAGARVDIRNARNKTALDLAREVSAPSSLVEILEGELVVRAF